MTLQEAYDEKPDYIIWVLQHGNCEDPEWAPVFNFVEKLEKCMKKVSRKGAKTATRSKGPTWGYNTEDVKPMPKPKPKKNESSSETSSSDEEWSECDMKKTPKRTKWSDT